MPWPRDYKLRTRARIVATAAAVLRVNGVNEVGVADTMARAGLTHGGFYAHFESRDSLLAEALEYANRESLSPLMRSLQAAPAAAQLQAVADAYLSAWHVRHVDAGCPVAAVGPEVARAGGAMLRNLRRMVRERLAWLRGLVPAGLTAQRREEQVVGALACMVGGLILARAVGGKESAKVLEACRGFLHRALGDAPAASNATRPTDGHAKKLRARSTSQAM
jgi:TetR/AcrR family transcriptional regulator, transcriptional repressor for nem operon